MYYILKLAQETINENINSVTLENDLYILCTDCITYYCKYVEGDLVEIKREIEFQGIRIID